jgi:hypothetical protein
MEDNNNTPMTVSELFSADTVPDITSALDALTADRDALEALLTNARYAMERSRERLDQQDKYSRRWERVARHRDELRQRDRDALVIALQQLHADQTPLALDDTEWQVWLRLAVRAGILAGYASEVHGLMRELEDEFGNDTALAIWNSVSAEMRSDDGSFPDAVSAEEALASAWNCYAHQLRHHPSDPRLMMGWERVWRIAKRTGLCDVWDTMAEILGVPSFLITKSGYVTVSGTFSVDIHVEELTDDDALDIGVHEVIENMGAYDLDIHDIDTSDLSVD